MSRRSELERATDGESHVRHVVADGDDEPLAECASIAAIVAAIVIVGDASAVVRVQERLDSEIETHLEAVGPSVLERSFDVEPVGDRPGLRPRRIDERFGVPERTARSPDTQRNGTVPKGVANAR